MKLLFLRGQVPQDRNPKQIMFDDILDCDDMWSQLARYLSIGGYGEIWYWNGKRKVKYNENLVERWIPKFKKYKSSFIPDVIFARGGFPEYDCVLKRYPNAYKIYYGAGTRSYPQGKCKFTNFNLILNDTKKQVKATRKKNPKTRVEILIKPVAENIFKPVAENIFKKYDIILVGNYNSRVDKGHDFAFKRIPKNYKILCAGIVPKNIRRKYSHVKFTGWLPRKRLPKLYSQSKIAIVCCGTIDSCPRVIPEALACDCPLLVLDRVNFWREKYINDKTGRLSSKADFMKNLEWMVKNYQDFSPYNYYKDNLSLQISVDRLNDYIKV